ncbi:MAG TPA: ATP-binding protein [Nitrososphaera sp.]|nr:ATP-binding protein [Nitrososphaera sp.]
MIEAARDFVRRGGTIRVITEITKANLPYVKQIMGFQEIRHLDGVQGNFGVSESNYSAAASVKYDAKEPQYIFSNSREIIRQHSYLFATLWSKATPAAERIRELENDIELEKTEVWEGTDQVRRQALEILRSVKTGYDHCIDSSGPSIIFSDNEIHDAYRDIMGRGARIRLITEVTHENLPLIKQLGAELLEIRHMSGIRGNFGVVDRRYYGGIATTLEGRPPTQYIHSNVQAFVEQQQYFFEMLWEKAIPVNDRVNELERGLEPEFTEVVAGAQDFIDRNLRAYAREEIEINICSDSFGPSAIVSTRPVMEAADAFVTRGGKIRLVTEITAANIVYCKELMRTSEIRHLDGVRGNFGVSSKDHFGYILAKEGGPISQVIHCTIKNFIAEQKFLFETLWKKAIPASQRIAELEKGVRPRTIELIHDTRASIGKALDIMNSSKQEYMVLFANAKAFVSAEKMGIAKTFGEMIRRGVNVRILVPNEKKDESMLSLLSFYGRELAETAPGLELKLSDAGIGSKISFLVSDKREVITWELRDETVDDPYEVAGVAVYSNIEALALSYATIFDNLWKVTDLTETLLASNSMLQNSQRAMKEFINIAAHELRTPIQPILGLSQILQDGQGPNDQRTTELLKAIERNARRLGQLAEEILDVARIEGGTMTLQRKKVDLWQLLLKAVHESSILAKTDVKVVCTRGFIQEEDLIVSVDPSRITQVVSNLLNNSLKFTHRGKIAVVLGTVHNDAGEFACIRISDTGTGIHREIMPRLFQKFVSRSEKGTGLGLFISKGIVEVHGGKIWAENNSDGMGATVSFTLPLG